MSLSDCIYWHLTQHDIESQGPGEVWIDSFIDCARFNEIDNMLILLAILFKKTNSFSSSFDEYCSNVHSLYTTLNEYYLRYSSQKLLPEYDPPKIDVIHCECNVCISCCVGYIMRISGSMGYSAIHAIAGNNHLALLKAMKLGKGVENISVDGSSALHYAAVNGHDLMIEWLLKLYDSDAAEVLSLCNQAGKSCYELAEQQGHFAVSKYLLQVFEANSKSDNVEKSDEISEEASEIAQIECISQLNIK